MGLHRFGWLATCAGILAACSGASTVDILGADGGATGHGNTGGEKDATATTGDDGGGATGGDDGSSAITDDGPAGGDSSVADATGSDDATSSEAGNDGAPDDSPVSDASSEGGPDGALDADSPADAGPTFLCGSKHCSSDTQYCLITSAAILPIVTLDGSIIKTDAGLVKYTCVALPACDSGDTCSCIASSAACACSEKGDGVTVDCRGGIILPPAPVTP
jgi:hypothetical protein